MEQEFDKPADTTGDFAIDPQAYNVEVSMLNSDLSKASENISPSALSEGMRSYDRIRNLFRPEQIYEARDSILARINIDSDPEQETQRILQTNILNVASNLLVAKKLEQIKKISEREGNPYFLEQFIQLYQFSNTGDIYVKMGGISIRDIDSNPNLDIPSVYRFFMTPFDKDNNVRVFNENKTPLAIKYPNIARDKIIETSNGIIASLMDEEYFEVIARNVLQTNSTSIAKEIISSAKEMIKKISALHRKIYNTILDPNSPDFQALKGMAENFLQDDEIRDMAISQLGIDSIRRIISAYRKAKELSQKDNDNSSFYGSLAHQTRSSLEDDPRVLTQDDLDVIMDTDVTLDNATIPTLEDLRKLGASIFRQSNKKEYVIEPEGANWSSPFILPKNAKIAFSQANPNQIYMQLHYESKENEVLDLLLLFDTKRGEFNWLVLEAPDDPEMTNKKDAVFLAAKSILSDVQKQVEAEYQQKQKERQAKSQKPHATTRQTRPKEPYVPRQKEERQQRPRPLTPLQEILQGEIHPLLQPEQQRIKNQIVIREDQDMNEITENVSLQDSGLVIKAISEYNERGVGQFKRLRLSGEEKEPLFTLRVNTGLGGGGIRVLMHEVPNAAEENNTRSFEVLDIDYRKNIYRKRRL
ncbi:MAG: hypothetical protein AAB583_01020 [Patescibacteria group bacterium]